MLLMQDPLLSDSDIAYHRDKEKQLRDKEKQLRDKENKLLDEKKQLRDEENKLLDEKLLLQNKGVEEPGKYFISHIPHAACIQCHVYHTAHGNVSPCIMYSMNCH
jgi:hypothetical protein